MTTKVYIPVNGTCIAGPDENLMEMLRGIDSGKLERGFSERLNRTVSGGATVLWVRSPSSMFMIDTGDVCDREILEKSLGTIEKEEKVDPTKAVIYHGHSHLDHNGNNDLFDSYWMIDLRDELIDIALGNKDSENYTEFRKLYKGHRQRGITSNRFTRYSSDDHPGKPAELKIIDAPGHDIVNKAFTIEDDEVVVINLETGEETTTDRVVFTGDCLCDERYLRRFMDPELRETAICGNRIPTNEWWVINNQEVRNRLDRQNLESTARILKEKGLLIFGHGGVYQR